MSKRQWGFFIALTLCATHITWNCGPRQIPEPPRTSDVCDVAGLHHEPARADVSPGVDIYIDRSASMMGFVWDPQSRYAKTLRTLIGGLSIARYQTTYCAFSERGEILWNIDPMMLTRMDFYSGLETPLASWLETIARREHSNKISILVSDLIQSGGASNQRALIRALFKATGTRPEMRLLAFRSRFDGTYHVETRPGENYHLPLPPTGHSEDSGGRPFYLLVLVPSRVAMERLDRYVLGDLFPLHDLKPTEPALLVDSLRFVASSSEEPEWRIWNGRDSRRLPADRCNRGWQIAFLHYSNGSGDTEPLVLDLKAAEVVPLRDAGSIEPIVYRWTQGPGGWSGPEIPSGVGIDLAKTAEGPWDRSLSLGLGRPTADVFELYHIRIKPGRANLALPGWVLDWNTDDDSKIMNGNRTLNLELVVEAMTTGFTERVAFLDLVLVLRRGD